MTNHKVKEKIAFLVEERSKRTGLTADAVLKELAKLVFFDPSSFLNEDGSVKQISEMDEMSRAAIRGYDIDEIKEFNHESKCMEVIGETKKLRFADKGANIVTAMRHLGLLKDKLEIIDNGAFTDKMKAARLRAKNAAQ